jgi:hypothetical protein
MRTARRQGGKGAPPFALIASPKLLSALPVDSGGKKPPADPRDLEGESDIQPGQHLTLVIVPKRDQTPGGAPISVVMPNGKLLYGSAYDLLIGEAPPPRELRHEKFRSLVHRGTGVGRSL